MNRPIKVSIAMTTYNGEEYILKQIGSIFAQSRKPDEVIICDDGSSDRTASLIEDFIKTNKLDTWHLHVNTANLGFIKNFHQAIGMTTGDVIFLCDQDDVWHADKIDKMVKLFEDDACIKVLNSGFQKIDRDDQPIISKCRFNRSNNNLILKRLKPKALTRFDFDSIIWRNISPGCTLAFTAEVKAFYLQNHTELCPHDWEINIFGAMKGGLYFYNEALIGYRIHTGNTIGLADLKLSQRVSGKLVDQRIEQAEQEFERAKAYASDSWAQQLEDRSKAALSRYLRTTQRRYRMILSHKVGLWFKLIAHPLDYLRLRGPQGILNDYFAVKKRRAE